jgi:hypothetical protein
MDRTRKINEYWMQEGWLNGYKKDKWIDGRMINKYMQERWIKARENVRRVRKWRKM